MQRGYVQVRSTTAVLVASVLSLCVASGFFGSLLAADSPPPWPKATQEEQDAFEITAVRHNQAKQALSQAEVRYRLLLEQAGTRRSKKVVDYDFATQSFVAEVTSSK